MTSPVGLLAGSVRPRALASVPSSAFVRAFIAAMVAGDAPGDRRASIPVKLFRAAVPHSVPTVILPITACCFQPALVKTPSNTHRKEAGSVPGATDREYC